MHRQSSFGGSHVPPDLLDVLDEAIQRGIPTVTASHYGDGPTSNLPTLSPEPRSTSKGGGAIMAGGLSAVKARLRLAVALATETPLSVSFPVE